MEQSPEIQAARDEVEAMMARAHAAQQLLADYTQEQVDELFTARVWSGARADVSV